MGPAAVYLTTNIANAAIPFLLLPMLARVLSPAEFGRVAIFQATVSLLAAFVGLNIHGAVGVRFFKSGESALAEFLPAVLLILAGSTAVLGALLGLGSPVIADWIGLERSWLLAAVAVAGAQFVVTLRLIVWQLRQKPWNYGFFQVSLSLVNAGLSIGLVVGAHLGASGRMGALLAATVFFALIGLAWLQRDEGLRWRWNIPQVREALRFGLPLLPHTVSGMLVLLADRFIITRQVGVGATGSYFVALQFALPLALMGDGFNRAFVPWLYDRLATGRKLDAAAASYSITLLLGLAGLAYAVLVFWTFPLLVGPQYQGMRGIAMILIGGGVLQAAYYAFVNYIFYSERTELLSSITVSCGCLYFAGGWYLCGRFGVEALAWWFTAIQTLIFLATMLVAMRTVPMPWMAWGQIIRTVAGWLSLDRPVRVEPRHP
jgi:O-antigen/teichoic acid export membrane protein